MATQVVSSMVPVPIQLLKFLHAHVVTGLWKHFVHSFGLLCFALFLFLFILRTLMCIWHTLFVCIWAMRWHNFPGVKDSGPLQPKTVYWLSILSNCHQDFHNKHTQCNFQVQTGLTLGVYNSQSLS